MGTREGVVPLQREILRTIQRKIDEHLGDLPPEVRRFKRDYERALRGYRSVSSREDLLHELLSADVVFCGDYHTLAQAQRTELRILRDLVRRRPEVVLGLEMVPAAHQTEVDAFLAGALDERGFLKAINYRGIWGFPWEHYRPLFELAREHGLPVVALNTATGPGGAFPSLAERDRFVAGRIAEATRAFPGHVVFVVFGDLHLSPAHLPRETARALRRRGADHPRLLVVHQNGEAIYWRLAEQGLADRVDVVRLDDDTFCIIGVPPWVKLQSYLDWLEDPERSTRDEAEHASTQAAWYEEQVYAIGTELAAFLGLPADELDTFQFHTMASVDFLADVVRRRRRGEPTLHDLITRNPCCFFPDGRLIYLSTLDVNHAAEAAAEFLNWLCSRYETTDPSPKTGFYRRCVRTALGYFGSMFVNHKRKCWYFRDHHLFVMRTRGRRLEPREAEQRRVSLAVLRHQRAEDEHLEGRRARLDLPAVYALDLACGYAVSKALGYIMGDKFYRGMVQEIVSRDELRDLFRDPLAGRGAALRVYVRWRRELKRVVKSFTSKDDIF